MNDFDTDEEDLPLTVESMAWQLLLLINPGDEDSARLQFEAWQDALAGWSPDDAQAPVLDALRNAIDWRAGFTVEAGDTAGLVQCLDELAARFDLTLDWDEDDDGVPGDSDVPGLISFAHDRLRIDELIRFLLGEKL